MNLNCNLNLYAPSQKGLGIKLESLASCSIPLMLNKPNHILWLVKSKYTTRIILLTSTNVEVFNIYTIRINKNNRKVVTRMLTRKGKKENNQLYYQINKPYCYSAYYKHITAIHCYYKTCCYSAKLSSSAL